MVLVLKASWLLDGRGGMPLANPVVLVDGDRIVASSSARTNALAVAAPGDGVPRWPRSCRV